MRAAQIANREADLRFPVRVRIAVPPSGLGDRLDQMHAWLDEHCGLAGWAMAPSGARGIVNDAAAIYFLDAAVASAFVSRWCKGRQTEVEAGAVSRARGRASATHPGKGPPGRRSFPFTVAVYRTELRWPACPHGCPGR